MQPRRFARGGHAHATHYVGRQRSLLVRSAPQSPPARRIRVSGTALVFCGPPHTQVSTGNRGRLATRQAGGAIRSGVDDSAESDSRALGRRVWSGTEALLEGRHRAISEADGRMASDPDTRDVAHRKVEAIVIHSEMSRNYLEHRVTFTPISNPSFTGELFQISPIRLNNLTHH